MLVRVFIALVYVPCFLVGTPANILSLFYFCRSRSHLSSLLHLLMNLADLTMCLLIVPPLVLNNLTQGEPLPFSWEPYCVGWYLLQMMATRYSIFLIGVISLLRTWLVMRPLALVPRRKILVLLPSYLAYILARFLFFHFNNLKPEYFIGVRHCIIISYAKEAFLYGVLACDFLEIVIPTIIIVSSCAITVVHLNRAPLQRATVGSAKRKATITVIILTVVYIFFNLPCVIDRIIVLVERVSQAKVSVYMKLYLYSPEWYFAVKSSVVGLVFMGSITSTINPLVFIVRMKMLSRLRQRRDSQRTFNRSRNNTSAIELGRISPFPVQRMSQITSYSA